MSNQPNIIITITDDQRHSLLGCCDGPTADAVRTPHLDALAQRGCRFTHVYHGGSPSGAICSPSRAGLHTGRGAFDLPKGMAHTTERLKLRYEGPGPAPTLGQLLRQAGYKTYITGKWHNDDDSLRRSFDQGKYVFRGGMHDHFNTPVVNFHGKEPCSSQYIGGVHSTDAFTTAACEMLTNHTSGTDADKPFLLYVAFTAPHDPRQTHAQWHRQYVPDDIQLPPNQLPEHPFDNGELNVRDEMLTPRPRDPWQTRKEIADYYAMTTHMDHGVGMIHRQLARLGLLENTWVIHTADHGLSVGQHGLIGKQNMYDHSVRVPLLMAGPGVPQGRVIDSLCYQHDLFPTLLTATGIDIPDRNAYQPLQPLMHDAGTSRPWVFSYYQDCQRMVTDGKRKLIRYHVKGQVREQSFDLQRDPWEHIDPKTGEALHPASDVADLRQALAQWQSDRRDPLVG